MDRPQQLSPVWKPYAESARATGHRLTESTLRPGRSGARLDDLARRLFRELDRMTEQAFTSLPGGDVACAPGCDHCCRTLRVTVSPIEVFVIARRLRGSHDLDPGLRDRLTALAHEATAAEPVAAPGQRDLPPCPLLGDGLCAVYSSRPLACRGCVSGDASLCAACDDERLVPRSTAHQLGAAAMVTGVTEALSSLGLAGDPIELRSGLALAFCSEEVERRWLRGQDVFTLLRPASSPPNP